MKREWEKTHMLGHVTTCPGCGTDNAFAWTDDLSETIDTTGGPVTINGLTGHRCAACGTRALDMASALAVERTHNMP